MSRANLLQQIVTLVGAAQVVDAQDGWPGIVDLDTPTGPLRVALHVGPVGLSHRHRDDVERRFQNPGRNKPLQTIAGCCSLLVGLWDADQLLGLAKPVLVLMEVTAHRLTSLTRQSYFVPVWVLQRAASHGWASHLSGASEQIEVFVPDVLPAAAQLACEGAAADMHEMSSVIQGSGMLDPNAQAPELDRARRQTLVLARKSVFGKRVVDAYGGRCAMCGLNVRLVEGAHIYPACAPGSHDIVENGLCLCRNHHGAFDRHLIFVNPVSREISLHPDVYVEAAASAAGAAFVTSTFQTLTDPANYGHQPTDQAFTARYAFYDPAYNWA